MKCLLILTTLTGGSLFLWSTFEVYFVLTALFINSFLAIIGLLAVGSVLIMKGFLKRNLADVGVAKYMNALADKVHNIIKKCHAHSDMHSIPWPH